MEGGYGAKVYDAVYRWKDYDGETLRLREILTAKGHPDGTLLDIACGTGQHLSRLRENYRAEGLELDPEMAAIARSKGLTVTEGDMACFDLGRQFDAVTCLFSSIGYMETPERLATAIGQMANHLVPGGVLVIEPWFYPEQWFEGHVASSYVNDEKLKIARMSVSKTDGAVSVMDLHHMVATPSGVETFVTKHRMGLFADWEYREAFQASALIVEHDAEGLMGRGLYIGLKPV